MQNVYLDRPDPATLKGDALKRYHSWTPFHRRIKAIVMPNLKRLIGRFRDGGWMCCSRASPVTAKLIYASVTSTEELIGYLP